MSYNESSSALNTLIGPYGSGSQSNINKITRFQDQNDLEYLRQQLQELKVKNSNLKNENENLKVINSTLEEQVNSGCDNVDDCGCGCGCGDCCDGDGDEEYEIDERVYSKKVDTELEEKYNQLRQDYIKLKSSYEECQRESYNSKKRYEEQIAAIRLDLNNEISRLNEKLRIGGQDSQRKLQELQIEFNKATYEIESLNRKLKDCNNCQSELSYLKQQYNSLLLKNEKLNLDISNQKNFINLPPPPQPSQVIQKSSQVFIKDDYKPYIPQPAPYIPPPAPYIPPPAPYIPPQPQPAPYIPQRIPTPPPIIKSNTNITTIKKPIVRKSRSRSRCNQRSVCCIAPPIVCQIPTIQCCYVQSCPINCCSSGRSLSRHRNISRNTTRSRSRMTYL